MVRRRKGIHVKKLALLGGVAVFGCAALLVGRGHAADHIDSSTLATATNAMADINDVYSWMSTDGKVNLVMTVSPADPGGRSFGPGVQYVFHATSKAGDAAAVVGAAGGVETRVVCTFASATSGQCWVTSGNTVKDWVMGDPSDPAGIASTSGKIRFFAGRRSDPFFFNLQGFRNTVSAVASAAPGLTFDAAGCPSNLPDATAGVLRTTLAATDPTGDAPCPNNEADCFADFNVMAIVVQVDKSLLNQGTNTFIGVWGSTHTAP